MGSPEEQWEDYLYCSRAGSSTALLTTLMNYNYNRSSQGRKSGPMFVILRVDKHTPLFQSRRRVQLFNGKGYTSSVLSLYGVGGLRGLTWN